MWKLRRFRFSVRALLILSLLVAFLFAIYAYNKQAAARQVAIVKQLRAAGGSVIKYEWEHDVNWNPGKQTYSQWIERLFSPDELYAVNTLFLESNEHPDDLIELASGLRRLRMLKLPGCKVTASSLQPLVGLRHLEWLDLFMTNADDQCVNTVSKLKSLRILDLRNTKVTDDCVDGIISLPNLSQLLIVDTALSDTCIERLRISLPNCKLVTHY